MIGHFVVLIGMLKESLELIHMPRAVVRFLNLYVVLSSRSLFLSLVSLYEVYLCPTCVLNFFLRICVKCGNKRHIHVF